MLWETRSVTRASDKLALSQPAVSHALRRLRDAVGDELFVKAKAGSCRRRARSTDGAGARGVVEKIGLALQEGETFVPSLAQREFRIAAGDLVEFSIAPQLIEELGRSAPGILIKLVPVPGRRTGPTDCWRPAKSTWCWTGSRSRALESATRSRPKSASRR